MVKGVTRQIILVDSPDPNLFEKAIFILKDGHNAPTSEALLLEAQEIADAYLRGNLEKVRRWGQKLLYAACGAAVMGAVWLCANLL